MNRLLLHITIFSGLSLFCCKQTNRTTQKIEFNQGLAEELKTMAVIDQVAAYIPQGKYKQWTHERWEKFKDSVFTAHTTRLKKVFHEFGFPGYDLVGKEGSNNFWLMVQHADKNIGFQSSVLKKLKITPQSNSMAS